MLFANGPKTWRSRWRTMKGRSLAVTHRDAMSPRSLRRLRMVLSAEGWELQDAGDENQIGRLRDATLPHARASAAGSAWHLCVERGSGTWRVVARPTDGVEVAACYYPGALPGGRLWINPIGWCRLRTMLLPFRRRWRLMVNREEVLRVLPIGDHPTDRFDILVRREAMVVTESPLLLVLMICWITMIEDSLHVPRGDPG